MSITNPALPQDEPARAARVITTAAALAGRVLLAVLFLPTGLGKIGSYAATAGYMQSAGVPAALLPAVIALEIVGAIALILGWQTRIAAFLLAGFTLLAGILFHNNFADPIQWTMFLKNLAVAGGLLLLVANGAGAISLDRRARK